MSSKFVEFYQDRSEQDFNTSIDNFCEAVAKSGVSFNKVWFDVVEPIVESGRYRNEKECLKLMEAGLFNRLMGGGQKRNFGNPDFSGLHEPIMAQLADEPVKAQLADKPGLPQDAQTKVGQNLQMIKSQLGAAMQTILDKAKANRDSIGFQVAQHFSNVINKAAEQMKFKQASGTFDKTAAFGAQPTGQERRDSFLSTPEGKQRMANTYAQKLGVEPEVITRLIDGGLTNPAAWPQYIAAHKAKQKVSGGGTPTAPVADPSLDPSKA